MAFPPRLVRAWRSLDRFGGSRRAGLATFVSALGVYAVVSVALPLGGGRDLPRYLLAYAQLFDGHVLYPQAILMRAPGTPLVAGALLDAGSVVAELGSALLYALSILAWWAAARRIGGAAAFLTALALLAYPGYVILFHQLSSDLLFAAAFALFALLVARALELPGAGRAAALGASVAALVLVRPVAQVLLLLVLAPVLAATTWRARAVGAAAFLSAALLPLVAWAVHNQARLDDFTLVRGGGHSLPLFRAFVADRIVEPDNGSASRELATAVQRRLLTEEPYRSYGIDLDEFFSSGSFRMHEDLVGLSDRIWGWDDDYRLLGRVGREAVLEHPGTYARGVALDVRDLLYWSLYAPTGEAGRDPEPEPGAGPPRPLPSTPPGLPEPSEGEPIPASHMAAYLSTPEGRIFEEWTSATDHFIRFREPEDGPRSAEVDERVGELLGGLPDRTRRLEVVERLNDASRWYPRPIVWLLVGLALLLVRRPAGAAAPLAVAGAALFVLVGTALAAYAVAEYSAPVAPAFVLLAAAGAFGRPTDRATVSPWPS